MNAKSLSLKLAALSELFVPMNLETMLPTHNFGRESRKDWASPEGIAQDIYTGYDVHFGTVKVHPIEAFEDGVKAAKAQWAAIIKLLREDPQQYFQTGKDVSSLKYQVPNVDAEGKPILDKDEKQTDRTVEVTCGQVADIMEKIGCKPKYWVISACRRTWAFPWVLGLRQVLGMSIDDFRYPVDVVPYVDADTTIALQVADNSESAKVHYSLTATLQQAVHFLDKDITISETRLGEMIGLADRLDVSTQQVTASKRGERQKFYRWATVCLRYPKLNILERCQMMPPIVDKGEKIPYEMGGYLPIKKFNKELAQGILGKAKPNAVIQEVFPELRKDENCPLFTDAQVELILKAIVEGTKASNAMLNKTQLEAILNATAKMEIKEHVGAVLRAVVNGNANFFNELGDTSK